MMTITIPITPGVTDNRRHIFATRIRRFVDSPEYRAWKGTCFNLIKGQLPWRYKPFEPTFEKQLLYQVKTYLPDKRSDAANYDKGLRDVFTKAGVWTDDKWCVPAYFPVEIDAKNPRLEVFFS